MHQAPPPKVELVISLVRSAEMAFHITLTTFFQIFILQITIGLVQL